MQVECESEASRLPQFPMQYGDKAELAPQPQQSQQQTNEQQQQQLQQLQQLQQAMSVLQQDKGGTFGGKGDEAEVDAKRRMQSQHVQHESPLHATLAPAPPHPPMPLSNPFIATAMTSTATSVSPSHSRERFLLRMRREAELLSASGNPSSRAAAFFPHLFAASVAAVPSHPPSDAAEAAPAHSTDAASNTVPSAKACFPSHPLLESHSWRSHSINYDALRNAMKKIVYIQSQMMSFIREQQHAAGDRDTAQADSGMKAEVEVETHRVRPDRTPRPPEEEVASVSPSESAPAFSPSILASLQSHPNFHLLHQAHEGFWTMLRAELDRMAGFAMHEAHAERTDRVWDALSVQAQSAAVAAAPVQNDSQGTTQTQMNSDSGAMVDVAPNVSSPDAQQAAQAPPAPVAPAPLVYSPFCACGCGTVMREVLRGVLLELLRGGVSAPTGSLEFEPAPAPPVSTCARAKRAVHKFLASIMHLEHMRRFLLHNFIIYQRVLDQYQHYTANPTLDVYHQRVYAQRAAAERGQQSKEAKDDAQTSESSEAGTTSETTAENEDDIPFLSIQAHHLGQFLSQSTPFGPLRRFLEWNARAEHIAQVCFDRAAPAAGFEGVGAEMAAILRSRGALAMTCSLCHSPSPLAATLLPCSHVFCLGCLALQTSFGLACPVSSCARELQCNADLQPKMSVEGWMRAEERRLQLAALGVSLSVGAEAPPAVHPLPPFPTPLPATILAGVGSSTPAAAELVSAGHEVGGSGAPRLYALQREMAHFADELKISPGTAMSSYSEDDVAGAASVHPAPQSYAYASGPSSAASSAPHSPIIPHAPPERFLAPHFPAAAGDFASLPDGLRATNEADQAKLLASHTPCEGDDRPLTNADLLSGNYVLGCGGTVAAPLQYEEVTHTNADGSVQTVRKPKRGTGYSCHHCKTTKEPLQLFFCSTLLKKGKNVKSCKKKYCESCIKRLYTPEYALGGRYWSCPSCKGACVCASCERKLTGRAPPRKKKASSLSGLSGTITLAQPLEARVVATEAGPLAPYGGVATVTLVPSSRHVRQRASFSGALPGSEFAPTAIAQPRVRARSSSVDHSASGGGFLPARVLNARVGSEAVQARLQARARAMEGLEYSPLSAYQSSERSTPAQSPHHLKQRMAFAAHETAPQPSFEPDPLSQGFQASQTHAPHPMRYPGFSASVSAPQSHAPSPGPFLDPPIDEALCRPSPPSGDHHRSGGHGAVNASFSRRAAVAPPLHRPTLSEPPTWLPPTTSELSSLSLPQLQAMNEKLAAAMAQLKAENAGTMHGADEANLAAGGGQMQMNAPLETDELQAMERQLLRQQHKLQMEQAAIMAQAQRMNYARQMQAQHVQHGKRRAAGMQPPQTSPTSHSQAQLSLTLTAPPELIAHEEPLASVNLPLNISAPRSRDELLSPLDMPLMSPQQLDDMLSPSFPSMQSAANPTAQVCVSSSNSVSGASGGNAGSNGNDTGGNGNSMSGDNSLPFQADSSRDRAPVPPMSVSVSHGGPHLSSATPLSGCGSFLMSPLWPNSTVTPGGPTAPVAPASSLFSPPAASGSWSMTPCITTPSALGSSQALSTPQTSGSLTAQVCGERHPPPLLPPLPEAMLTDTSSSQV